MSFLRLSIACVLLSALALPASAGIFFNRQAKPKPKPEDRVPDLIATVRTDPDENKRMAAATELRQYDPKMFGNIVPALADVLRNDSKAGVRYEAAVSLSKIRPVSADAGTALEHAAAHDAAFYVRMQARTSLVYYRLSGYRTPRQRETQTAKKKGPKKNEMPATAPKENRLIPLPDRSKSGVKTVGQERSAQPLPDNTVARPLPQGPEKSPLVPVDAPKLETPPSSAHEDDGPSLGTPPF